MKTRLIVIADDLPLSVRTLMTETIKECGAAWWHWFQSSWLILDRQGRNANWWREKLKSTGGKPFVVLEVTEGVWSGFGPPKIFKWFHDTWDKD